MKAALVVLCVAFVLWVAYAATQVEMPSAEAAPAAQAYRVEIVSFTCDPNHGRTRADITVRNTGTTPIPYPKAFVSYGAATNDGYIGAPSLPVGSLGSATIYAPAKGADPSCRLIGLQDGDGNPVSY